MLLNTKGISIQCTAFRSPSITGDCQVKRYMYTGAVLVEALRLAWLIVPTLNRSSTSTRSVGFVSFGYAFLTAAIYASVLSPRRFWRCAFISSTDPFFNFGFPQSEVTNSF